MRKTVYLSGLLALCCSLFAISARAQAPVVTTNPVSDTICHAGTAWFHVEATGTTPLSFQWEFSTDGGTTWDTTEDGTVYLGTFDDTLQVTGSRSMNGTTYRCLVFNTDGSDTSDVISLSVDTLAASITGTSIVCAGSTTMLSNTTPDGVWSAMHPDTLTVDAAGLVSGIGFGVDTVWYTVTNECGMSSAWATVRVDTTMVPAMITGPSHVCVGNMITLMNTNVIGTHSWTTGMTGNSSVSASGVVTGLMSGMDTVTYTITNACNMLVATKEITIEVLPAAGTITGAGAVCAGSWIGLSSSEMGGIWLSGTPSVAVVNSAGNVTGIGIGTSAISYYQSNSCGAAIATHIVTVDIAAAPIVGNDSVGIDSTLMLTNIVPGGIWSSLDEMIATVGSASGTVTGIDTGITTIMYTVTNTCGTTSSIITMNVGGLPDAGTLTGPDTVCVGSTITLTPSVAGGTWVSRHDTIATVDASGVVTGVELGRDTVDYYVTTAFGRSRVTKRVYVNDIPMVSIEAPASVALGGNYTLTVTPTGGAFTTSNPAMTPLVGYGVFVVIDTGTSVFTYVATNGCGSVTARDTVRLAGASNVKSVGNAASMLSIFPNPTQGALNINITTDVTEEIVFTLTNVAGQKVQEFVISSNTTAPINVEQPAGVYTLTAVTKDGNRHSALITVTR